MATIATPIDTREISAQVLLAKGTDPANGVLVGLEDRIYLLYWSSIPLANLTITLRVLNPNGSISLNSYTVITNGLRSSTPTILPTGEGLLLGAVLNTFSSTSVRRGQLYAQLMLSRGGLNTTTQFTQYLCGGYVTSETPIFYPFSPYDPSMSGRGRVRTIVGTTPALGAEVREVVPTGAVWAIQAVSLALTTDAVVGSRTQHLIYDDGANGFTLIINPTPVQESFGLSSYYAVGVETSAQAEFGLSNVALPANILMQPGYSFRTLTFGLDPGDAYTSVIYLVEEWLQV